MWLTILLPLLTGFWSNVRKDLSANCEKLGSEIFLFSLVIYSYDFRSKVGSIWVILLSGSTLAMNSNFLLFLLLGEISSLFYEALIFFSSLLLGSIFIYLGFFHSVQMTLQLSTSFEVLMHHQGLDLRMLLIKRPLFPFPTKALYCASGYGIMIHSFERLIRSWNYL